MAMEEGDQTMNQDTCLMYWVRVNQQLFSLMEEPGRGGMPYICHTGMCRWIGYDFQA